MRMRTKHMILLFSYTPGQYGYGHGGSFYKPHSLCSLVMLLLGIMPISKVPFLRYHHSFQAKHFLS